MEVLGQLDSGEFVMSNPVCFRSFAGAVFEASSGTVVVDRQTQAAELFSNDALAAAMSTFTLGIHYKGYGGTDSSISVVGSSCSGGYWNTPSSWDDTISSTWNGCYRIKHHDLPNRGGSYASTYGYGGPHNVPAKLDDEAESISYWN